MFWADDVDELDEVGVSFQSLLHADLAHDGGCATPHFLDAAHIENFDGDEAEGVLIDALSDDGEGALAELLAEQEGGFGALDELGSSRGCREIIV